MKPTMSRDGVKRANFRIEFRLSMDELINLVSQWVVQQVDDTIELRAEGYAKLSKETLRELMVDELTERGRVPVDYPDFADRKSIAWAIGELSRMYPEWLPERDEYHRAWFKTTFEDRYAELRK